MATRLNKNIEQSISTDLQPDNTENTDIAAQNADSTDGVVPTPEQSAEPIALEVPEAPEAPAPENKNKEEKSKGKGAKKDTTESEIPDNISKILKGYPQYEVLYVDIKGGVFSPNTPEKIRGNAVAYSNPHFTK